LLVGIPCPAESPSQVCITALLPGLQLVRLHHGTKRWGIDPAGPNVAVEIGMLPLLLGQTIIAGFFWTLNFAAAGL